MDAVGNLLVAIYEELVTLNKKNEFIEKGDKVLFEGKEYFYLGNDSTVGIMLGDRFGRPMIGLDGDDSLKEIVKL